MFTAMDVTGLTPGKEYKFRVRAVNKEGESDPLESTKPVLAKNPFGKFLVSFFLSFFFLFFFKHLQTLHITGYVLFNSHFFPPRKSPKFILKF